MNSDRTEKFWDKLTEQFDLRAKYFKLLPAEQAKRHLRNNDTLLDFGCATGEVSNEIATCVKKVIGINISPFINCKYPNHHS